MRRMNWKRARNVMVFMADETDGETGETGLTLTLTLSKNGGAFSSISRTVTERGNGWYSVALTSADSDSGDDTIRVFDAVLRCTATGAKNAEVIMEVRPSDQFTGPV